MSNKKPKPCITALINSGRAFTLVELLLSLIIFSIVALSLYGMFTSGLKVEAKAKYIHETYQEAYMAFDLLERELSNAIKYDFSGFSGPYSKYSLQTSLVGQKEELTFLLPTSDGIDRVHYYVGPDRFASQSEAVGVGPHAADFLMRQQMPLSVFLNQSNPRWQEEIISTGLIPAGLSFAYASLKEEGQAQGGPQRLQWQDQWHQSGLPVVVRVTLTLFDPANPKEGVVLTREIYLPLGNG